MIDTRYLVPALRDKVPDLIQVCHNQGWPILVYCGVRSAAEQARLYRRSRTLAEIEKKVASLRQRGYPSLADILLSVGPQPGKLGAHVTNAGPGESWHQYGEAIDAAPMLAGKIIWDVDAEGWQVYGEACRHFGLTWAGTWPKFQEFPHVQLRPASNPLEVFTPLEVRDNLIWR